MRHLDLFSGIGGFSLAASWAWPGHGVICFCEQDKFCQKVLNKHWPDTPIVEDVRDVERILEEVEMTKAKYDVTPQMYDDGYSVGEIAESFGVTRQAMWMTLKRRGVEFRPRERYGADNHFYRGGATADGRVHDILELAIEKGDIARPDKCEACGDAPTFKNGNTGIQAHHDDYNNPLEVRWLCQKCHHEWHTKNKAKQLEIELPRMSREEICSLGGKAGCEARWGKKNLGSELGTDTTVDILTAGVP